MHPTQSALGGSPDDEVQSTSLSPSNRSDAEPGHLKHPTPAVPPLISEARNTVSSLPTSMSSTTKPRTRTMSSTMSFSAIFPAHSPTNSSDYPGSSHYRSHQRYDSVDSVFGPGLSSPSSDGGRNGEIVGSPFSMTSEDGYMLGTPASPSRPFSYATRDTFGSSSAVNAASGSADRGREIGEGKGKGKAREEDFTESADVSNVSAHRQSTNGNAEPARAVVGSHSSTTNSDTDSYHTSNKPRIRPGPIHSFTYTGPSSSNLRIPNTAATYNSSGRSTPTAHSASSSIHSKLSDMRIKMKRKGSSLLSVVQSKDVDRVAGRLRSGTTSSVGTTFSAFEASRSASPSAPDSPDISSKVNLRTKLVNRFDGSSTLGSPFKLFKRNKSSSSPPVAALNFTGQTPRLRSAAIKTPSRAIATPITTTNRDAEHVAYDYFSVPVSPLSIAGTGVTQAPICLGRTVNGASLMPLSPISPPVLDMGSALNINHGFNDARDVNGFVGLSKAHLVERQIAYFDSKLPRELKLQCFAALIELHKAEHTRALRDAQGNSKESREKAIRYLERRWVGEMAGQRELFKLGRVSSSWCELAFDGQLWKDINMHQAIGHLPPSSLLSLLTKNQGAYVRNLALNGWRNIPSRAFAFALANGSGKGSGTVATRLQRLDLQGCISLDAETLVTIIENSPGLTWLSLRGLACVNGDVLRAITIHADHLEYLDLSRCRRISLLDECICDTAISWPALKTLKLGGGAAEAGLLECLAFVAPNLEGLDVSYSPEIDDDEIKDFVSVSPKRYKEALALCKPTPGSSTAERQMVLDASSVMLTPSQAGQLGSAFPCDGLVPRRVTKLRHLNLSHCPGITQKAAMYLAYAVPRLEILEMANVGEMSSDGVAALFATTPLIRKIDLEGATLACDRVLAALTSPARKTCVSGQTMPGQALESFSMGHANHITSDAATRLLRACPKLVDLNLEGTPVTDILVKDFIRRKRRQSCLRVTDCRGVNKNVIEAYANQIRYRSGWRGYQAAPLEYCDASAGDGKDNEGRLDEYRDVPVVQSFWGWSKVGRSSGIGNQTGNTNMNREDAVRKIARLLREAEMQGDAEATRGCVLM